MAQDRKLKRLQKKFAPLGFVPTTVVYEPPMLMPGPRVYANDNANTWAVKLPGADPRVFDATDIIDCEVVEAKPDQAPQRDADKFRAVVRDPRTYSRANAAAHGYCLGLVVVIRVRVAQAEAPAGEATLVLNLLSQETKRTSGLYMRMVEYAQEIKTSFDAMKGRTLSNDRAV